jgi:hypothetical protein
MYLYNYAKHNLLDLVLSLKLEKLRREEKVNLSINMVDVVTRICAEGIKAQNKNISERELLEKLRERLRYSKNLRKQSLYLRSY